MEGVVMTNGAATRGSDLPAGTLKAVSWAAPIEAAAALGALPMQPLTAPTPMPLPSAPAPKSSVPDGFEALVSAPMVAPPSSPPLPQVSPQSTARLEAALMELRLRGERLAEQARSDSLELGLIVARKILEREIATNLEALFSLIKSAIRRVGESRTTTVRVSATDFERLHGSADTAFTLGRVELKIDPTLGSGDVMVDGEHATVDGRLGTRLEEIVRSLGDEA
jgi:flagellar assembly protein FliH